VEQRDEGFLPPEPSGPEPDLGGGQTPPQPQQPQQPQQPPPGYQPPPTYQPPPPAYQPPPAPPPHQPPPVYHPPAPAYYPTGSWQPPYAQQPGNGPAVAGFVVSAVSAALWLFSAGFATPLSIPGGIVGMVLARQGKHKVEDGETTKHKDLATAGWWIGIAVIVLSVISTIVWVLIFVLAANSDSTSFNDNLKQDLQDSQSSVVRLGLLAVALAARLFS